MAKPLVLDEDLEPIAGYTLVRLLGRGGFGEVWEARAPGDFHVALKFIRLDTLEGGVEQQALEVIRNIRHGHLLDVQFATRVADCLVIAMPLCDQNLMDRLRACETERWPGVPRNELLRYMDELARAVDYLNEPRHRGEDGSLVGVQHRDIKPDNIFLVGGSVRLADFGLAKILSATVANTKGNMTPKYAAPEVIQGQFSRWSDQYSLAVTYCELRTGRPPFVATNAYQLIYAHVNLSPELADIPEEERKVVARALAKQPADRWPTCSEFVSALVAAAREDDRLATHPTPKGNPAGPSAQGVTKLLETRVLPPIPGDPGPIAVAPTPVPAEPPRPNTPRPISVELTPVRDEPPKLLTNPIGMTLVLIPSGQFLMGSPDSDKDAFDNEKPPHWVRITRSFYLGAHEVTVGQFRHVVEAAGLRTEAETDGKGGYGWNEAKAKFEQDPKYTWRNPGFAQTDEHPVVNVSWNDAIAFCNKLSEQEGLKPYYQIGGALPSGGDGYRLPTEAEWEYACRAGTTTRFECGDDPEALATVGNIADGTAKAKYPEWIGVIEAWDGYVYTVPVGRFRANAFGLYDMHGNAWEWCWDGYQSDYYKRSPTADPQGASATAGRVFRGGSWSSGPQGCRAAIRYGRTPGYRDYGLGFRVARVRSSR